MHVSRKHHISSPKARLVDSDNELGDHWWDRIELTDDDDANCHSNIHLDLWHRIVREKRERRKAYERVIFCQQKQRIQNLTALLPNVKPTDKFHIQQEIQHLERSMARLERYRKKTWDELGSESKDFRIPQNHTLFTKNKPVEALEWEMVWEYLLDGCLESAVERLKKHPSLISKEGDNMMVDACLRLGKENQLSKLKTAGRQYWFANTIRCLAEELKLEPHAIGPHYLKSLYEAEVTKSDNTWEHRNETAGLSPLGQLHDEAQQFYYYILNATVSTRQPNPNPLPEEHPEAHNLDPQQVLESLPLELKKCFVNRDRLGLRDVLMALPEQTASLHFDRCVRAGLWEVPEDMRNKEMRSAGSNAASYDSVR
ncbi:hypothetical protein AAMO2058_000806400 [Amorphochlora amoebiformis]